MGEKLPSAKRLDLEAKVNPLWATHESWTRSLDVGEGYWARTLCDKDAEPKVQSVQDGCVDE